MQTYSSAELMVARAARELRNDDVVFVGIGLPNLACNLARHLQAPEMVMIYESGAIGALPERLPVSIGDPALVAGAVAVSSLPEVFLYYLQGRRITVGFLGAAQIDRFGNINTTVIGSYDAPKVRLPGSGGACDIAELAEKVMIIMPLRKRNFPEKVDFRTSAGYLDHRQARHAAGIASQGPEMVITDYGVFRFDRESGELMLAELAPGVTIDQISAQFNWPLRLAEPLIEMQPPGDEELYLIRVKLDPRHLYLSKHPP